MTQNRTHTCGELRLSDAGKAIKICGWLENLREVGSELAFAVVRDFYGTTQVVAETADMVALLKSINKESTISVEGTVRERDSKNAKLPTGEIEVVPGKIEVLGRCQHNELPFPINRSREADEATRLKYRYLDLRNPAVKNNIILRCQVVAALRAAGLEPIVKNTICSATRQRQEAAADLASAVDAMVVIGGRNSSTTTRLAEVCALTCPRTFHIESADELDPAAFAGCRRVGVTAGASTPENQIAAVEKFLRAL